MCTQRIKFLLKLQFFLFLIRVNFLHDGIVY